jgi:hypothetical protein
VGVSIACPDLPSFQHLPLRMRGTLFSSRRIWQDVAAFTPLSRDLQFNGSNRKTEEV